MNVEDFYDVNFRMVWDGAGLAIDVGPDTSKSQLKKTIQSGLTVDEEYEIFVRDSYGAVYGECPKKVVESPTVTQRLLGYKSVEELILQKWQKEQNLLLDLVLVKNTDSFLIKYLVFC